MARVLVRNMCTYVRGDRLPEVLFKRNSKPMKGQAARPSRLNEALRQFVPENMPLRAVRAQARATVHCSFNNTIVTISKLDGDVLTCKSGGTAGFTKANRSTSEAAHGAARQAAEIANELGCVSCVYDVVCAYTGGVWGALSSAQRWAGALCVVCACCCDDGVGLGRLLTRLLPHARSLHALCVRHQC